MENIDKLYSEFHKKRMGIHCYPSECLVRIMLGTYPGLKLSHDYEGKAALDWSCGDGRNLVLLNNLKLKTYGSEITDSICNSVSDRMKNLEVKCEIRTGRNNDVPYDNEMFDYVVAMASLYYVDHDSNFKENYSELKRILKRGGYAILSLCPPDSFIVKDAKRLENNHYMITNDPYGLRNGDIFKIFHTEEEITEEFKDDFEDICIGTQNDNYFGITTKLWLVVMRKK